MPPVTVTLVLSLDEANIVLDALQKTPVLLNLISQSIITKIQQQAAPQPQPEKTPAAPTAG